MAITAPTLAGYTFVRNIALSEYSHVYLYKDRLNKGYAVKVAAPDDRVASVVKNEIKILGQIERGPSVVKLSEYVVFLLVNLRSLRSTFLTHLSEPFLTTQTKV